MKGSYFLNNQEISKVLTVIVLMKVLKLKKNILIP